MINEDPKSPFCTLCLRNIWRGDEISDEEYSCETSEGSA